jgi:hypothetical protein
MVEEPCEAKTVGNSARKDNRFENIYQNDYDEKQSGNGRNDLHIGISFRLGSCFHQRIKPREKTILEYPICGFEIPEQDFGKNFEK